MNNIILKRLQLQDWKSRNIDVTFNRGLTSIKGRNGIGKTSLINAWCWLLTGYVDSVHPKNYELFDNKEELTPYTPKAIVNAYIEVNGCEYKLTRSAKASFTRKRGSVEWEKASSDKYETFIDDIEYSATQFNEWIDSNICSSSMLPFVVDGSFFSTLCDASKTKARDILMSIVGEIKDEDFVGNYDSIKDKSGRVNIENVISSAKTRKSNADREFRELTTKINFIVADVYEADSVSLDKKLEELKKELKEVDDKIENSSNGESEKMIELKKLRIEVLHDCAQCKIDYVKKLEEFDIEISDAFIYNSKVAEDSVMLESKRNEKKALIEEKKKYLERINNSCRILKAQVKSLKEKQFTEDVCAYCGQELPFYMIEKQKEKFNQEKEAALKRSIEDGKYYSLLVESTKKEIETLENELNELKEVLCYKDIRELEMKKANFIKKYPSYEDTERFIENKKKLDSLNEEIEKLSTVDVSSLKTEREDIREAIANIEREKTRLDVYRDMLSQRNEMKERQKAVASELAKAEGDLMKASEWLEERAEIISRRINDKLSCSSVQMWSTQKNGESIPDCLLLDTNGVKYGTTNGAERIKINIDVQRMFMNSLDVVLPVFIDECSIFSSYNIPKIDGQAVCIFASDDNKIVTE